MNYHIIYKKPTQQYINVEAEFNCKDETSFTLQFPAWRPGRYELGNFAKNVRNFSVYDQDRKKLKFSKTGKDTWQVESAGATTIYVSYYYYSAELNAGSTYMDDCQLYVNPVNCLVYNPEQQHAPCKLTVEVPAAFQIATGAHLNGNTLECESYHELVDSPFIASPDLERKTYSVFGIDFHIWVQGQVEMDWEKVLTDFEKFTRTQLEKFSDRRSGKTGFPVKEYHFLFQILAVKAYHGVEHTTSTVIALGPGKELMNELYDEFLGVSSHELYHVWNIKTIRPKEMFPYDYAKENFSQLGYVAEGVTTYLGDVFLAESGVKDFTWYKKELEKLLQRHFDNFGRFNYSVADSGWDTWLDGYVKGAPHRKVSIYNEGALLAFTMDMKIRKQTANKRSLHDVMNHLYVNFAEKKEGYTENDYKAACELFLEEKADSFFNDFVHGTSSFESILVEALETIGFTLEMKKNKSHSQRVLGIKTIESGGKTVVSDIFPGSSAELGALMTGDLLISVNGAKTDKGIDEALNDFHDVPLTLEVNRKGRILTIECPNTNRAMYPIYSIKKVHTPSNLSKRIFKKWIGHNWDDAIS